MFTMPHTIIEAIIDGFRELERLGGIEYIFNKLFSGSGITAFFGRIINWFK